MAILKNSWLLFLIGLSFAACATDSELGTDNTESAQNTVTETCAKKNEADEKGECLLRIRTAQDEQRLCTNSDNEVVSALSLRAVLVTRTGRTIENPPDVLVSVNVASKNGPRTYTRAFKHSFWNKVDPTFPYSYGQLAIDWRLRDVKDDPGQESPKAADSGWTLSGNLSKLIEGETVTSIELRYLDDLEANPRGSKFLYTNSKRYIKYGKFGVECRSFPRQNRAFESGINTRYRYNFVRADVRTECSDNSATTGEINRVQYSYFALPSASLAQGPFDPLGRGGWPFLMMGLGKRQQQLSWCFDHTPSNVGCTTMQTAGSNLKFDYRGPAIGAFEFRQLAEESFGLWSGGAPSGHDLGKTYCVRTLVLAPVNAS